jgi:hypothetical protein
MKPPENTLAVTDPADAEGSKGATTATEGLALSEGCRRWDRHEVATLSYRCGAKLTLPHGPEMRLLARDAVFVAAEDGAQRHPQAVGRRSRRLD